MLNKLLAFFKSATCDHSWMLKSSKGCHQTQFCTCCCKERKIVQHRFSNWERIECAGIWKYSQRGLETMQVRYCADCGKAELTSVKQTN